MIHPVREKYKKFGRRSILEHIKDFVQKVLHYLFSNGAGQNSKLSNFKIIAKRYLNFDFCTLNFELFNGFTLVELIIATGLFAILSVSAIGITLQATRAYLRAANRQAQLDNIRFGLDLLAREMRTGIDFTVRFYCTGDEAAEPGHDAVGPGIEFTNLTAGGRRFYFVIDTTGDGFGDTIMRIAKANTNPIDPATDCVTALRFMGGLEGTAVRALFFGLHGITPGWSDGQPWITINLILAVPDPYVGVLISTIQTTITPRIRDF